MGFIAIFYEEFYGMITLIYCNDQKNQNGIFGKNCETYNIKIEINEGFY